MPRYSYFFMGKRQGKSKNGDYFCTTLAVKDPIKGTVFTMEFYVDGAIFNKCDKFVEFQPVECLFAPTNKGTCKLIFIEAA